MGNSLQKNVHLKSLSFQQCKFSYDPHHQPWDMYRREPVSKFQCSSFGRFRSYRFWNSPNAKEYSEQDFSNIDENDGILPIVRGIHKGWENNGCLTSLDFSHANFMRGDLFFLLQLISFGKLKYLGLNGRLYFSRFFHIFFIKGISIPSELTHMLNSCISKNPFFDNKGEAYMPQEIPVAPEFGPYLLKCCVNFGKIVLGDFFTIFIRKEPNCALARNTL